MERIKSIGAVYLNGLAVLFILVLFMSCSPQGDFVMPEAVESGTIVEDMMMVHTVPYDTVLVKEYLSVFDHEIVDLSGVSAGGSIQDVFKLLITVNDSLAFAGDYLERESAVEFYYDTSLRAGSYDFVRIYYVVDVSSTLRYAAADTSLLTLRRIVKIY